MKELLFVVVESNYLEFLQAILLKHGLESYKVAEKKHFPVKYVPPKAQGQWLSDTIDVNDATDYKEMVKKISEDKPPVVKIFLPWAIKSSDHSECTSDSPKGISGQVKKTDLNNHLAQWHLKLQKLYKNKHDEGLTYVSPLGLIPLTPMMIQGWCLALEDGQATITTLPNIESFNMANKAPILHPM
ncbi:hypothetical protein EV401DRAFT_1894797 [Pisolithus croceorrhizus]|nr:hypothetical protein EV401DRAFT_1894797 [Pisolithus croceorrhizus]